MERAIHVVVEPYFIGGEHVATRNRYNDRFLMFLLHHRAPERFADGKSRGMGAFGEMEKKRLKKQWRAEWEAERTNVSPAEVRASIDRKIEGIHLELEAERASECERLSPETRPAHALLERLKARDERRMEDKH